MQLSAVGDQRRDLPVEVDEDINPIDRELSSRRVGLDYKPVSLIAQGVSGDTSNGCPEQLRNDGPNALSL